MATNYLMQAADPDGELVTWLAAAPDWLAAFAPTLGDGAYIDVALAGGGIDNGTESLTDNQVTAGGVAVTSSGAIVLATANAVTAGGLAVVAGGIAVIA
jgi:hypothetical protein